MTRRMLENRITAQFKEFKTSGKKALIGYLTAGDPDLECSERGIRCALDEGLDILELGVPFSDPIADGPVIQAASRRALEAGTTIDKVLALVKRVRADHEQPILLFGYTNPFLAYGFQRLCQDAAEAGVDGLLIVDLSFEETEEMRKLARRSGLVMIPLIAPTTPKSRARFILKNSGGFVYCILVTGVTGVRDQVAKCLKSRISMIRKYTDLPVVAGFGISQGDQARKAVQWADGVVVGSALITAAREGRLAPFIRDLRRALSLKA